MKLPMCIAMVSMMALMVPACAGSGTGDETLDAGDDIEMEEDLGEAEQAIITCPDNRPRLDAGTRYSYTYNGNSFRWTIVRRFGTNQVAYRNERTDGSWSQVGTAARWSVCPHANEPVQVINASGQSQSCTHVCLSGGKEELHCPTAQLNLTKIADVDVCVSKSGADEGSPTLPDCGAGRDINLGCITPAQCKAGCKERSGNDPAKENTCLKDWNCDDEDGLSTVGMYLDDDVCNDFDFRCPELEDEPITGGSGGISDLYAMCWGMGYVGGCPLVY